MAAPVRDQGPAAPAATRTDSGHHPHRKRKVQASRAHRDERPFLDLVVVSTLPHFFVVPFILDCAAVAAIDPWLWWYAAAKLLAASLSVVWHMHREPRLLVRADRLIHLLGAVGEIGSAAYVGSLGEAFVAFLANVAVLALSVVADQAPRSHYDVVHSAWHIVSSFKSAFLASWVAQASGC